MRWKRTRKARRGVTKLRKSLAGKWPSRGGRQGGYAPFALRVDMGVSLKKIAGGTLRNIPPRSYQSAV